MPKKKYYTIMIVKDPTKVRKYRISNVSLYVFALLTIATLISSGFMFYNYLGIRLKVTALNSLRMTNEIQDEQIREFVAELDEITARMNIIRGFNEELRVVADLKDVDRKMELFGIGGPLPADIDSLKLELNDSYDSLVVKLDSEINRLEKEARLQEESLNELLSFLEGQENFLSSTPSIWPTRGFLTSGFGMRWGRMHEGIDIANKPGTPIYTSADGIVIFTGIKGGYGKFIIINHGYGYSTAYGHLKSILVREGDRLKRGDMIGTIGNSGRTTGPHLHYEVRINNVAVDPMNFILN